MKTFDQIRRKIKKLKKSLIAKAKASGLWEDFGDKEQRLLDGFIGDVYAYDYTTRQKINAVTSQFSDWCMNYTT